MQNWEYVGYLKQRKLTNQLKKKRTDCFCRASAITELIETRGENNHDFSAGNSYARKAIENLKELIERHTPTVVVASAVLTFCSDFMFCYVFDFMFRLCVRLCFSILFFEQFDFMF